MEQPKRLKRSGRRFSFAFVFLVANYVGVSLLYQAGELPVFREYKNTVAVVVRSYVEERAFATAGSSFSPPMEGAGWCPRIKYKYEVIDKSIQPVVFMFYGGVIILWLLGKLLAIKQLTAPNKALQAMPKIGAHEV